MKYRKGFVSNSSSSSFLILGTRDKDIVLTLLEKMNMEYSPENGIHDLDGGFAFVDGYDKPKMFGLRIRQKHWLRDKQLIKLRRKVAEFMESHGVPLETWALQLICGIAQDLSPEYTEEIYVEGPDNHKLNMWKFLEERG
jgi:hypothetical protein